MVLSEDQIKFIAGIIISIPLSYYLRKIQKKQYRYLYSFILGTLIQFLVYGFDIWMSFLMHLIVYSLIKIKGRKSGALITVITIISLSIYHIYRLIVDYGSWKLDVSTILMSMVCKYSLFAYAYEDGAKQKQKLTPNQEQTKLQKLPSFYQYLTYCQFLPTCIIGTAVQFKNFQDFMEMKEPFKNIPFDQIMKKILQQFGYSLICGVIYISHIIFFPISIMQDQAFANESPLFILYFSFFSVALVRFKYYFGWKLSQCAVHASGISYYGKDDFSRIRTCDPWKVQSTIHLREKVANWNMSSQLWLRRCIYERAPFKNKQLGQGYTFMISSFWHGFYGGYYFSFGLWFLQINLATKVFKFVQLNGKCSMIKIYKSLGIFGQILLWIIVNFLFTHHGLYFQILDSNLGLQILKTLWCIPPLIIVVAIFIFDNLNKKSSKSFKENKDTVKTKQLNVKSE